MEARKRKTKTPSSIADSYKLPPVYKKKDISPRKITEADYDSLMKDYIKKISMPEKEISVSYSNATNSINSKPYYGTITTGGTGTIAAGSGGGGWTVNTSPSYVTMDNTWTNIINAYPPPKKEQKFEGLTQAQAISALLLFIQTPEVHKSLCGLVGELEMPTREDVLTALQWIDETRQTKVLASSMDSRLNAIKSVSNFLAAVSKELNSVVVDGKALIVEAITSE